MTGKPALLEAENYTFMETTPSCYDWVKYLNKH